LSKVGSATCEGIILSTIQFHPDAKKNTQLQNKHTRGEAGGGGGGSELIKLIERPALQ